MLDTKQFGNYKKTLGENLIDDAKIKSPGVPRECYKRTDGVLQGLN